MENKDNQKIVETEIFIENQLKTMVQQCIELDLDVQTVLEKHLSHSMDLTFNMTSSPEFAFDLIFESFEVSKEYFMERQLSENHTKH